MTPEVRAEKESSAERALRRGELSAALGLYTELVQAFPGDPALQARLDRIRENLQPAELHHPKARLAAAEPAAALTPEQEGERLFALGDFAGAAAAYRRALDRKPDSDLIKERLLELFRLAQAAPRNAPAEKSLPIEPEERLKALLDRIASRKQVRRA